MHYIKVNIEPISLLYNTEKEAAKHKHDQKSLILGTYKTVNMTLLTLPSLGVYEFTT